MHNPDLHGFVDDHLVERSAHLERVLNRPRRRSQPVLQADRPWEGGRVQAWGSVVLEPDGLLRMWYLGIPNDRPLGWKRICFAYAESRDGVEWRKPDLGLESWHGSAANNLFYGFGDDDCTKLALRGEGVRVHDRDGRDLFVVNNMDGMTVLRDDDDPDPQRRYKLFANMQDHRMWAYAYPEEYPGISKAESQAAAKTWTQCMDTSPDGLHWTKRPTMLVEAKYGDYMMVGRDRRNQRWWINQRPPCPHGRAAGLRYSTDLATFTDPPESIFAADAEGDFGRTFEWHGGITPFNYGTMDLGFLEAWRNTGAGDTCELVSHRDGQPWQRVMPGRPFLDVGPEGSFDRCLAYPTHNPPIRLGDELLIFYTGLGPGHRDRQDYSAAIGVMTIGLDRFAGMANARKAPGELLTRPLAVTGDALTINIEPGVWGKGVRVGLLDESGASIPGYGLDACEPVMVDGVRLPVRWKDRAGLAPLRGRRVKLLFEITGATLYAFAFGPLEEPA
jgi:hypothetical protein